jgi:GcrA cell cycle regulator
MGKEVHMMQAVSYRHPKSNWTPERIGALSTLWDDGLSASQIASKLGEVSRNAVIGKVHRLGLAGRATTIRAPRAPRTPKPPFPRKPSKFRPFLIDFTPYDGPKIGVLDLKDTTCHWPLGDPLAAGFGFCGCEIQRGQVYCSHHAVKAYNFGRAA